MGDTAGLSLTGLHKSHVLSQLKSPKTLFGLLIKQNQVNTTNKTDYCLYKPVHPSKVNKHGNSGKITGDKTGCLEMLPDLNEGKKTIT